MQPRLPFLNVVQMLVVFAVVTGVDAANPGEGTFRASQNDEENKMNPASTAGSCSSFAISGCKSGSGRCCLGWLPSVAGRKRWLLDWQIHLFRGRWYTPRKNAGWNYHYDDYGGFVKG
jgi:hypothetical protein